MIIPRKLAVQSEEPAQPHAPAPPASPQTWISMAEASALLKIRPSAVISSIEKGTVIGKRSPDIPFTYDGKENYVVLLESLPQRLQIKYQTAHLSADELMSVDLVSPRSSFGDAWTRQFINVAQFLRDAALIRQKYHGTGKVTQHLAELSGSYGISLSALYRFEGNRPAKSLSLLYTDPVYLQDHLPRTMCLWSCDLALALCLSEDSHYSNHDIFEKLDALRDYVECASCPYFPFKSEEKDASAASDTTAPQESGACCAFDEDIPSCGKCPGAGHHMVVPNNRKAVDRLLSHIPPQLICFQRRGYREWRSKYVSLMKTNALEKLANLRTINEDGNTAILICGVQKLYDDLYSEKFQPVTCSITSRLDEYQMRACGGMMPGTTLRWCRR